jgi:TetR/AcrR family transcriptional regulator
MSDSKARILEVATRRFAKHGYGGTSLQGIADDVGMRKQSLLYHFPSKEVLREAVLSDLLDRWQTTLPVVFARAQSGQDRFSALFDEVSGFFEADPGRAILVMREVVDRPRETRERLGGAVRPWLELLRGAIDEGRAAGRVHDDVDPEAYLVQCVVLIVGSVVGAQLGAEVFGGDDPAAWAARQREEARRMARLSLFIERR